MADDGLRSMLEEGLAPLGPVVLKRMFGGYGVFLDGLMFGLVADGVLYLKADETSRGSFEAEGLGPFTYEKKSGAATVMSYWQAPERLLDDTDELVAWARAAHAAAKRSRKLPSAARPKRRPTTR